VLILPVFLWAAVLGTVSFLNWRYYGLFTTCELKHHSFASAYGALLRVKHVQEIPFIPVPRETRERIYRVSPAFAELQPYLEGPLGESAAANSVFFTGIPASQREIAGGWFVWALRDAVASAGHAHNAAEAMRYYAQLAREVNAACDRGLLPAGPKRTGMMTPLQWKQRSAIIAAIREALRFIFLFGGMEIVNEEPSLGDAQVFARYGHLTHDRLSPLPEGPKKPAVQARWDHRRMALLERIHRGYVRVMPWTGAVALISLVAATIVALVRRRLPFFLVFSLGGIGSLLALTGIIALIDATSYPASGDCLYLVGGYGLWLLCQFTSGLALVEVLGSERKQAGATPAIGSSGERLESNNTESRI
jgi:hypothetical protein